MDARGPWRRSGSGLVNVLVVVLIIGILVALVVPAVQRVREAGNRTSCLSKLRQIVIACHNHQDQQSSFPPAYGWVGTAWVNGASYGTLHYQLVPYIEANWYYETTHVTATATDGKDYYGYWINNTGSPARAITRLRHRLYECPSDPTMPADGLVKGWGATSYAANAQVFARVGSDGSIAAGPDNAPGSRTPGAGYARYAKVPDSFGDGAATTILVAEKYAQCGSYGTLWCYPYDNGDGSDTTNFLGYPAFIAGWRNTTGDGYVMPPGYAAHGAVADLPAALKFQVQPRRPACNPHGNGSTGHPAGINVALADGSSRVINANASVTTWWALLTPNGHDEVGSDW